MRIFAGIMVFVVAVVGIFFGYCYYGAQMQIESVTAILTPAVEMADVYNDTLEALSLDAFYGEQYRESDFLMPDSYAFLTLTVRMANRGLLPQDWIRIEVRPDASDILQLPADRTPTLAAASRGDFSTTLLTRAGAATARTVIVTYYVLGHPYQVEYAM